MTHRYGRRQKALPRKRRPALSVTPDDREKEDQRHASLYCSMHSNLFSAASTFLSVIIASNCAFAVVCFSEGKRAPAIIFSAMYIVSSMLSCFSLVDYFSKAQHLIKKVKNMQLYNMLYSIDKKLFKYVMVYILLMLLSVAFTWTFFSYR